MFAMLVLDLEPDIGRAVIIPVSEFTDDLDVLVEDNLAELGCLAAVLWCVFDIE